jgi:hypothetical protein
MIAWGQIEDLNEVDPEWQALLPKYPIKAIHPVCFPYFYFISLINFCAFLCVLLQTHLIQPFIRDLSKVCTMLLEIPGFGQPVQARKTISTPLEPMGPPKGLKRHEKKKAKGKKQASYK